MGMQPQGLLQLIKVVLRSYLINMGFMALRIFLSAVWWHATLSLSISWNVHWGAVFVWGAEFESICASCDAVIVRSKYIQ